MIHRILSHNSVWSPFNTMRMVFVSEFEASRAKLYDLWNPLAILKNATKSNEITKNILTKSLNYDSNWNVLPFSFKWKCYLFHRISVLTVNISIVSHNIFFSFKSDITSTTIWVNYVITTFVDFIPMCWFVYLILIRMVIELLSCSVKMKCYW